MFTIVKLELCEPQLNAIVITEASHCIYIYITIVIIVNYATIVQLLLPSGNLTYLLKMAIYSEFSH